MNCAYYTVLWLTIRLRVYIWHWHYNCLTTRYYQPWSVGLRQTTQLAQRDFWVTGIMRWKSLLLPKKNKKSEHSTINVKWIFALSVYGAYVWWFCIAVRERLCGLHKTQTAGRFPLISTTKSYPTEKTESESFIVHSIQKPMIFTSGVLPYAAVQTAISSTKTFTIVLISWWTWMWTMCVHNVAV